MLSFIYKPKIKTAVFVTISVLIFIMLIQGFLAVYNVYDSRKQSLRMASLIISKDTENMSELFSRIDSLTNIMENDKDFIYASASKCTNNIVEDSKNFNALRDRFQTFVSNSVMNNSFFNSFLFLYDELPLSYIAPDFSEDIDFDVHITVSNIYNINNVKNSEWIHKLNDSADTVIWSRKINNRITLCFAKKISMRILERNDITFYPIGIFYLSYDLSSLLNQLELTEMYPSSTITLLYNDEVIYQTGSPESYSPSDNINYTSSIYPGLTLMTSISKRDINSPFTRQTVIEIIMLVLTLLFGILVLSYISNAIISPITNMAHHLLADERSTLSYKRKLNPEIDVLYTNHNYMVEHTKKVMEESRKNYYKMLQAQINPHFTYNVLNSISAMSLMKGDIETAQTLSNLVVMLRYGINAPDVLVEIEKEIEIINNFVSIQNFRYDNNINIKYDIPDYLLQTKMPKLTLQPLVENSIFHSDKSLAEGDINIYITAKIANEKVMIEIYDNNSADPQLLNSYISSTEDDFVQNRRGLGIRNISQRLSFIFGDGYGIKYALKNGGLCTTITLPISHTDH